MGLKITPITAVAGTVIKSSDYNSNFQAVINASDFNGTWDASNNSSVGVTNTDTTQGTTAVLQLAPKLSGADRGLLIGTVHSGSLQKSFWIDTNGVCRFFQDSFDNNNNEIAGAARFTGNGEGIYNHNYSGGTPNFASLTSVGENPVTIGYETIGSSTIEVEMNSSSNFVGWVILM